MKRICILLLALCLLTACGVQDTPDTQPQKDPVSVKAPTEAATLAPETEPVQTEAQEGQAPVNNREYSYTLSGVTLTPGQDFQADALPEAESFYQIPSCAFEGTDNVYGYGECEVIAYNEGKGEKIYSIYLLDPNAATPEGLALGDEEAKIVTLYGPNYVLADGQYTYMGKNSQLVVLTAEGFIISIEIKMNA